MREISTRKAHLVGDLVELNDSFKSDAAAAWTDIAEENLRLPPDPSPPHLSLVPHLWFDIRQEVNSTPIISDKNSVARYRPTFWCAALSIGPATVCTRVGDIYNLDAFLFVGQIAGTAVRTVSPAVIACCLRRHPFGGEWRERL